MCAWPRVRIPALPLSSYLSLGDLWPSSPRARIPAFKSGVTPEAAEKLRTGAAPTDPVAIAAMAIAVSLPYVTSCQPGLHSAKACHLTRGVISRSRLAARRRSHCRHVQSRWEMFNLGGRKEAVVLCVNHVSFCGRPALSRDVRLGSTRQSFFISGRLLIVDRQSGQRETDGCIRK